MPGWPKLSKAVYPAGPPPSHCLLLASPGPTALTCGTTRTAFACGVTGPTAHCLCLRRHRPHCLFLRHHPHCLPALPLVALPCCINPTALTCGPTALSLDLRHHTHCLFLRHPLHECHPSARHPCTAVGLLSSCAMSFPRSFSEWSEHFAFFVCHAAGLFR